MEANLSTPRYCQYQLLLQQILENCFLPFLLSISRAFLLFFGTVSEERHDKKKGIITSFALAPGKLLKAALSAAARNLSDLSKNDERLLVQLLMPNKGLGGAWKVSFKKTNVMTYESHPLVSSGNIVLLWAVRLKVARPLQGMYSFLSAVVSYFTSLGGNTETPIYGDSSSSWRIFPKDGLGDSRLKPWQLVCNIGSFPKVI